MFTELENDNPPTTNTFIVMWCMDGLEAIVPVDMDQFGDGAAMLHKLQGTENDYAAKINRTLQMMEIRARFNGQRHYEIYTIQTNDISQQTMEELFEDNPQMIVDLIREKGKNIFNGRATEKAKIF